MLNAERPVDILLATYNGEQMLPRQLNSILAQTYPHWRIIARDDGSKDGTSGVLERFAADHPGKMVIVRDGLGNLKPLRNFATLLAHSDAPLCGFSDQDDLWDSVKLETAVNAIAELEAGQPAETPAMVVTDRRVVDQSNAPIARSFWENQGVHPREIRDVFGFMLYPVAAGSSLLMNAALRRLVQPIPDAAIMHDCWIELVAARFARTRYIDAQLLEYTRHSANASGSARAYPASRYVKRARALFQNLGKQRAVYRRYLAQARAFRDAYADRLGSDDKQRLDSLLAMQGASVLRKPFLAWRSGALPPGWERKIAVLLLV